MSSLSSGPLSTIPAAKRKQLAATLGLFAVLFVAVGAVAATGPGTAVIHVFVAVALLAAVLLALMAWGVAASVRTDTHATTERDLDAAIEAAVAASPQRFGQLCDCGHEHDPTELHITDADPADSADLTAKLSADACAHDGAGLACGHDCASCILGGAHPGERTLRPSPTRTRAERQRS